MIPAVDLRAGQAVRLVQGDPARQRVYGPDPAALAIRFARAGARRLHVVDLDGAFAGRPCETNLQAVAAMVAAVPSLCVTLGGGLRSEADLAQAFAAGVQRVVVGTAVIRDPGRAGRWARLYPARISAGLDIRRGQVAVEGWTRTEPGHPEELLRALVQQGIREFIVTDITRDGTLAGPGLEILTQLAPAAEAAGATLIASGGIGSLRDLEALDALACRFPSLRAVVVGKAFYEGTLPLSVLGRE